jgi:hypothetical protein
MQSIFSALFVGAGPGFGGIVGGINMQRYGAATMFLITAGVVLGGWAVTWLLDCLITCVERRRPTACGAGAAPRVVCKKVPAAASRPPLVLDKSAPSFYKSAPSLARKSFVKMLQSAAPLLRHSLHGHSHHHHEGHHPRGHHHHNHHHDHKDCGAVNAAWHADHHGGEVTAVVAAAAVLDTAGAEKATGTTTAAATE